MMSQEFYATAVAPHAKHRHEMRTGRFSASLMQAPRLTGDHVHGLPPGHPVPVYPVDMFPGCPKDWVREPGSYVCPVDVEWGLWFNWTQNDHLNTAVLPSVKGMNPITGQKIEGLRLEQYAKRCPKHDEPFKGDERFCKKCGYKWPPQSYVAHPNTLWWDVWKQPDGTGRQFFFSEDEARDIASLVIGKNEVVPAFGFAFFEPKKRREPPPSQNVRLSYGSYSSGGISGYSGHSGGQSLSKGGPVVYKAAHFYSPLHTNWQLKDDGHEFMCSAPTASAADSLDLDLKTTAGEVEEKTSGGPILRSRGLRSKLSLHSQQLMDTQRDQEQDEEQDEGREQKAVSVGAGAQIRQDLAPDPLGASDWKDEASAIMRLYFVFKPQFKQIVKAGVVNIDGDPSGAMRGLPVG